jgi:hypothetical protein
MILSYVRSGMEIGFHIAALPTPLPRPAGQIMANLGAFLSSPFQKIAGWLGYTLWVLLCAKLLGGRATVAQTLGATALYAIPHVLNIFNFVDCLGPVLGLVALGWSIAIYVKALAAAHDFSIGKAALAAVAPAVLGAILALAGGFLTLILIALSG